jgi:hypothetical protein
MTIRPRTALRLELDFDPQRMNLDMAHLIERLFKEAGTKLGAYAGMLADPQVLTVSFEEWTPDGWKPCDPVELPEE